MPREIECCDKESVTALIGSEWIYLSTLNKDSALKTLNNITTVLPQGKI